MFELHPASVADAPVLLALLQAAYAEYKGQLDPPSGAHSESITELTQKLSKCHAFKALLAGQVVGCVFYEERGDQVYLGRLAVLPAYRRQGIARRLVEAVEQYAAARQIPQVMLGVRLALPGHIAYYTKLGYQIAEYRSHPGYTVFTSVDMVKRLDKSTF